MASKEFSFLAKRFSEIFVKMLTLGKCCMCNNEKDLCYYEVCMHVVCLNCIDLFPGNTICLNCSQPGDSVYVSEQSIPILARQATRRIVPRFKSVEAVPFYAPNVYTIKKNHQGETALHKVCRKGNLDVLKDHLEKGIDPNEPDFAGWTPLHETTDVPCGLEVAKLLVEYGTLVNIPVHVKNYETPLIDALWRGKHQLAEFLVKHGADLNSVTKNGFTVFDHCSTYDMFRMLCVTPPNSNNYVVFTIPNAIITFLQNPGDVINVASQKNCYTIVKLSALESANYLVMVKIRPNNKVVQLAMLKGILIVDVKWCLDYVEREGKINPMDYVIKIPDFAFDKSAWNMFNRLPKLFHELYFHFHNNMDVVVNKNIYTVEDLKDLVTAGDGKTINRSPCKGEGDGILYPYHTDKNSDTATINTYVIFDGEVDFIKENFIEGVKVRSTKWFISCINHFTIFPDPI